ncbi:MULTISPECIES: ATP-grasp ribosomal peptide maturase [Actinoalloteichus]|uniref:ATP-grasp ribosomal peptide maturase n=1 Tax=Actinoalloteichus fjordicus TaxID=1612552 RepID=A0AAC9LAI9_9PSEU|nr:MULTISPECIES: ATP-grasp ribosomal peptide maturase [Actinoalloteichus]APU14037.1 ATP-grasp ribosomal peptide maturase [Actinoalloteichus fjordicus]APU19983.1 ATP-grasp ribosomal peptide maturase [Actinoalloteichus sp. GBA129-24]
MTSQTTAPTVVVFAQETDAPVDAVVCELTERGVAVFRADTSWFPNRLVLDAGLDATGRWTGALVTEHRRVDLEAITAVWYRDPAAFRFPDSLTDVERAYAHREARLGFGGVLAALPGVLWVNNPNRAVDAMFKPVQLATAAAGGLRVPATLVTNDPAAVTAFAAANTDDGAESSKSGVVCKSFGSNAVTEGGRLKVAYTHRLTDADLADLRSVASTATQVQRWVDKSHEARVIVIGRRMFTILIHAHSAAARVDWRADYGALTYELVDTPLDIERGLRAYMDILGLAYAAVDFAFDTDGRAWFLESNGSGQYGWLESRTGAPISAALADLLTEGTSW